MNNIRKICIRGFFIRILMLVFILSFSNQLTTGYLRSTTISDDIRYQEGALIYSQTATSIIDINAFEIAFSAMDDNIWMSDHIQIWYWIVCVLTYMVKSSIIVKLINICFAVACIYLLYLLALEVYHDDLRVATLAAKLYAYLPFPVVFSCFLYKDQFLTLVLLGLLLYLYRIDTVLKVKSALVTLLFLLLFSLLRSGMLPILIICIGLFELKKRNISLTLNIKTVSILALTAGAVFLIYTRDAEVIMHKFDSYVSSRIVDQSLSSTTIQFFFINSIWDIWKLPFSYLFTIVQPLYIGGGVFNWESFVSIFNVFFIPIAIGNFIYIFKKDKGNSLFWICIMLIYSVMLVVSLGVGRHFFYLIPYTILFYSDYYYRGNKNTKSINNALILACEVYFLFCIPALIII